MNYALRGQIHKWDARNGENNYPFIECTFYVIDTDTNEFLLGEVIATVNLHYSTGDLADTVEIVGEFFGNDDGSMNVQFCNLPEYEYGHVEIKAYIKTAMITLDETYPVESMSVVNRIEEVTDINEQINFK